MQNMDNGQADETRLDQKQFADEPQEAPVAVLQNEKMADWREDVLAEHSGTVQAAPRFGTATDLMKGIQHALDSDFQLLGRQIHVEDADVLRTLVEIGFVVRDEISDLLALTTNGRVAIGLKPHGVPDLPVEVAEITGNIDERELAARYAEGKVKAIDQAIAAHADPQHFSTMTWKDAYEHFALQMTEMAREFRMGLHLPDMVLEGRVIPYNEDRSTGISHATALRTFFKDVHSRNLRAGWWTDIETGMPKKRNIGELLILFVTEIAEGYLAWRDRLADDKLTHYPGLGVEMADLGIRWADFCGAALAGTLIDSTIQVPNPGDELFREIVDIAMRYDTMRKTPAAIGVAEESDFLPAMDIALMTDEKLAFNAHRPDHKIENRLKEDGKRT